MVHDGSFNALPRLRISYQLACCRRMRENGRQRSLVCPRYMNESMQNTMNYVLHFCRQDIFVTFTCNPKSFEITRELLSGERASYRHELIAQVLQLKVTLLIRFNSGKAFGDIGAYVYTIE